MNNFRAYKLTPIRTPHFSLKKIWRTSVLFLVPLIPLFWTSGDVSPGLQSQVGSPCLHASSPVPQIYLWCNTWWPLSSKHGNQAVLFHILANKHWWGSRPGSIVCATPSQCETRQLLHLNWAMPARHQNPIFHSSINMPNCHQKCS